MTTRLFHFTDDKSNKFWQITLDGTAHTVQYGRIGTDGQTQTKEFGSEDEARKSAEKLVAEKVKKGYVEQGASAAAPVTPVAARKPVAPKPQPEAPAADAAAPAPAAAPAVPAVPAAAAPAPAPIPADPDVPRSLHLSPREWMVATWRPRVPLPLPEPPPFNKEEAAARLAQVTANGWHWDWEKARISPALTREEAEFWLTAILNSGYNITPKDLAAKMLRGACVPVTGLSGAVKQGRNGHGTGDEVLMLPLSSLHTPSELVSFIIQTWRTARGGKSASHGWSGVVQALCHGFAEHVLPYLSNEAFEALREEVRAQFDPADWPAGTHYQVFYEPAPPPILIGAHLGLYDGIRQVVEAWPDGMYVTGEDWSDYYHRPQEIIFGLGSAAEVEHHMRRLKLRLRRPEYVTGWLAHTEYSALDVVRDSLLQETNKDEAHNAALQFARVHAPEAAPHMLELTTGSKAARVARGWLEAHPEHTVTGLIPVAVGRGKLAEAAVDYLRSLRRKGGEALIAAALERAPAETAERARAVLYQKTEADLEPLDDASTPAWLAEALATAKKAKAPTWISPADLPAIRLGDRRLNDAQVSMLLAALAQSKLEEPHALVTALRTHGDRPSLDAFGWRLFEQWIASGAQAKDKWAMLAVGLLGNDVSALKLTPLVRAWPGESQHQRAVTGLECLRAIGTDTALMQINGIAQKVPFKGLKTKAGECMEGIATDRGLTRAQLEDRIVPDCDLDEKGSRIFDFGPRQFQLVLGPNLKPMVKEADGKLRPDLPKPTAKDEAALAEQAVAEWKLLKKQVAEVAKVQAVRLEQAMVTGRRWPREEFELLLVRHPLMTNLVRLLVWGAYDAQGTLTGTFRVTEDLTYGDSSDELFELPEGATVGIVHPYHLAEAERAAWGELFSDYELVPPFTQIGRPILTLESGEADSTEITRFKQVEVPPQSLVFGLEKQGWQRGLPEDGGVFYSHSKPFYGADLTAIVEYDGVPVGYMEGWDDQKLERCYFIPGIWKPDWYPEHKNKVPLDQVDPVVISEVLSDLTGIAAKGK